MPRRSGSTVEAGWPFYELPRSDVRFNRKRTKWLLPKSNRTIQTGNPDLHLNSGIMSNKHSSSWVEKQFVRRGYAKILAMRGNATTCLLYMLSYSKSNRFSEATLYIPQQQHQ